MIFHVYSVQILHTELSWCIYIMYILGVYMSVCPILHYLARLVLYY